MEWLQKLDRDSFAALWVSKHSAKELCALLNISYGQLWKARLHFGLPTRAQAAIEQNDPTPEDIAQQCAAFRATWSDEEEERRRVGYRRRRWEPYYV